MARLSPISLIILVLIATVLFLAFDLHQKSSKLRNADEISEPENFEKISKSEAEHSHDLSLTVIYNRIPKTASTAFTHVLYDLSKGMNLIYRNLNFSLRRLSNYRSFINNNQSDLRKADKNIFILWKKNLELWRISL